ncbi:hypothetical protein G6F42_025176 [Rhizopus arrhizus]|nr:hypothetical protein G6F42_025176 [Rhizopus arrhizus]
MRRILMDSTLTGYALPLPALPLGPTSVAPTAVKMLAYSYDIICLLNSPADLQQLQSHLFVYSRASNALVNYHKTEAISLSGSPMVYGPIWRSTSPQHNITVWHHDARSLAPTVFGILVFLFTHPLHNGMCSWSNSLKRCGKAVRFTNSAVCL